MQNGTLAQNFPTFNFNKNNNRGLFYVFDGTVEGQMGIEI
jgi:hypothetical protein